MRGNFFIGRLLFLHHHHHLLLLLLLFSSSVTTAAGRPTDTRKNDLGFLTALARTMSSSRNFTIELLQGGIDGIPRRVHACDDDNEEDDDDDRDSDV